MQAAPIASFTAQPAQQKDQPANETAAPQMTAVVEIDSHALQSEFISLEMTAMTQLENELHVAAQTQADESEVLAETPVSDSQREMIDQKIRQLSERLDSPDASAESLNWQYQGQKYSASISHISSGGEMDLEKVTVEVITEQNGVSLTTQLRMKRLAFSNFAQFVNRWDDQVSVHDDTLDGRFHSNSKIYLDVDPRVRPVFHSKVTTASHSVKINRSGRFVPQDNVFRAGVETGVKKIEMPTANLLFTESPAAGQNNTFMFAQDTRIVFTADRQFHWQNLKQPKPFQTRTIGEQPIYIQAAKGVSLHVSGAVDGKVLIYSPKQIVIEGDLVYARHPGSDDGESVLGLVSARNIAIASNKITGPGDLQIDAAIYAARRFIVRGRNIRRRGTLQIFGSLSAGSLSATEPRFATRIVFDPRLENTRPPRFPQTSRYELMGSDAIWTAALEEEALAGEYAQ